MIIVMATFRENVSLSRVHDGRLLRQESAASSGLDQMLGWTTRSSAKRLADPTFCLRISAALDGEDDIRAASTSTSATRGRTH
jgi:hypothetical protein